MWWNNNTSAIEKRLKTLEDTMIELSLDIGTLKASIMRLNAKTAVEARIEKKSKEDTWEEISPAELLKAIIKQEPITNIDLSGTRSTSTKDNSTDSS